MSSGYSQESTAFEAVSDVRGETATSADAERPPFVSVIIPVYNDRERLTTCLHALQKQTYPPDRFEVLVVDNGSTEPISPVVEAFSQARCLHEPEPGSYAARNRGIAEARGDVLAFTDSDCVPSEGWIEQGVKTLLSEPNVGMVAGKVELFAQDPARPNVYELYDRLYYLDQQAALKRGHYGATANLFTSRSVVGELGAFDGRFKSGGDSEWGRRVFRHGYKQLYAESARVGHPARNALSQLHRKTVRITGGLRDRDARRPDRPSPLQMFLLHARMWKPPLRKVAGILVGQTGRSLPGPGMRIKLAALELYLHYLRRVEFLRLAFGGRSKNC